MNPRFLSGLLRGGGENIKTCRLYSDFKFADDLKNRIFR